MRRMIPNLVSGLRLALVVPLGIGLWAGQNSMFWRWAVVGLFVLIACSDWVDGLLARRLDAQTDLGRFLDPAADKVVALVAFVLLAAAGLRGHDYSLPLAAVVVGKDLWTVTGYLVIRMMGIEIVVRPSRWGKASTSLQLALVGVILIGPLLTAIGIGWLKGLLIWLAGGMTVVAAGHYTWVAIRRLATVRLVPSRVPAGDP